MSQFPKITEYHSKHYFYVSSKSFKDIQARISAYLKASKVVQ